jgi:hypothetical protein
MDFLSIKPIGERQAAINVAEGERQSKILQSEAVKIEQINEAQGEASATIARAEARARAIRAVAEAIGVEVCYCSLLASIKRKREETGCLSMAVRLCVCTAGMCSAHYIHLLHDWAAVLPL